MCRACRSTVHADFSFRVVTSLGMVNRWMKKKWQLDWDQGGQTQGSWRACSSTALPCPMKRASTALKVPRKFAELLLFFIRPDLFM